MKTIIDSSEFIDRKNYQTVRESSFTNPRRQCNVFRLRYNLHKATDNFINRYTNEYEYKNQNQNINANVNMNVNVLTGKLRFLL